MELTVLRAQNCDWYSHQLTKNSGLVATLATRFLYDLDLIKRVKLKQTFHLFLLCFCHKKCAKLHILSQFTCTSKFVPTSVCDIFKQSNLMDRVMLWAASFTVYKLATKNLHLATIFLQLVAKRWPEDYLILGPAKKTKCKLMTQRWVEYQQGHFKNW